MISFLLLWVLGELNVAAKRFVSRTSRLLPGNAAPSSQGATPLCHLDLPRCWPPHRLAASSARCRLQRRQAEIAAGQTLESRRIAFLPLSTLLLVLMVSHKCVTDGLSRFTRRSVVPYSANVASILSELVTVPVLLGTVLAFEGRAGLQKVLKLALTDSPFSLALPGLAYSIQNILYYQALSHLSVASYQVLSQSKLLFTGLFMAILLKRQLSKRQMLALVFLMLGTILTQLSEMSRSSITGGNALYGGFLAIAGAALSALPNVYYEKVLKTQGQNMWSRNIQLSCWIWFWLIVISFPSLMSSSNINLASGDSIFTGITAWVWVVIVLQGFKAILVPATLKYGDNILYSCAKPMSILLTALFSAVVSGIFPGARFVLGAVFVLASMRLYGT